jgi:polygalacturonase
MTLKKMVGNSVVRNLLIQSWPVHCFYISGAQGLLMENIILNNSLGDAPNERSEGKSAVSLTPPCMISTSLTVSKRVITPTDLAWLRATMW